MRLRIARRIAVPLAATALLATALGGSPATSQIDTDLSSLSLDALLELANVDAPPAGIGLEIHADFPADRAFKLGALELTSLTAVINPDRTVEVQNAVQAARSGGPTAAEAEECTDPTFLPTGRTWRAEDLPVKWTFRRGTTPARNSIYRTQGALREAHAVWTKTVTRCSDNDSIDFSYDFTGLTSRTVKYDGHNIVEFGRLGSYALAINYTWFSGTRILETDLRLNRHDYNWTNRPGGRRYHVKNVAAHELGHQVGLDDLSDPHGGLTMFGRIRRGESKKTTLGSGDLRGAGRLSP